MHSPCLAHVSITLQCAACLWTKQPHEAAAARPKRTCVCLCEKAPRNKRETEEKQKSNRREQDGNGVSQAIRWRIGDLDCKCSQGLMCVCDLESRGHALIDAVHGLVDGSCSQHRLSRKVPAAPRRKPVSIALIGACVSV
eukprot:1856420-Rhodomonas_salina.1